MCKEWPELCSFWKGFGVRGKGRFLFFWGGGGGEFLVTSGIATELHSFGKGFGLVGIARIKFPLSYSYIEI